MSALTPCAARAPFTEVSQAQQRLSFQPMRFWRWLPLLLALLWLVLLPVRAQAQNVLVISTLEAASSADVLSVQASIRAEFPTADWAPNAHLAGTVTAATFASKYYDLVLVAVMPPGLEAGNLAAVNTAIQTRAANAFVMMYDTGGGTGPVSNQFRNDLNTIGNLGVTVGGPLPVDANLILNTNSPFQGSFTGLNPLGGGYTYYLNNVPPANALYLAPGSSLPAAGSTAPVNNVYGVFIPVPQSFNGQGACVLCYTDLSMFEGRNYNTLTDTYWPYSNSTGTLNQGKLATAWLGMTQGSGACGLPAIAKAFSPSSVMAGQTSTLTLTLANGSGAAAGNLNVTDNLPAPLVAVGTPTTTCTGATPVVSNGGRTVSLTGATLPAAGCTITVTVEWPASQPALCQQTAPGNAVTNTITPGTDFTTAFGQVRTPATAALACTGVAAPVPTLSAWLLSALGLLVMGFGWTRLRTAPRSHRA